MAKIVNFKKEISSENLIECVKCIRNSGIVIFPTETVYGIGANALDSCAVEKIFKAKGRKSDNPLIVLVSDEKMLEKIVQSINGIEKQLIEKFWPGPLTIIFDKKDIIPEVVSAKKSTIGVRIPGNEIARKLIHESGVPITAPSANLSGKLCVINAQDAKEDFDDKVDYIIDGGETEFGIESTIVRVENDVVNILRCGQVLPEEIERLGLQVSLNATPQMIPGKKNKHYQIEKEVWLITGTPEEKEEKVEQFIKKHTNMKIGILGSDELYNEIVKKQIEVDYITYGKRTDTDKIAKFLFQLLKKVTESEVNLFLIEGIEENKIGNVIMKKWKEICNGKYIE